MKVLIVEDEIMAQKSLTRVLTQNFPDMNILGYTSSVKGTVEWLKSPENAVDVIFMDVELSDGVCFEIFRQVEIKAKVIMTTAYDSYALKAFEAGSIDYLLKPIDPTALKRAVARCRMSGGQIDVNALLKAVESQSAPKKEYSGTTTGFSTAASTGAKETTPTMASAREPMARIPSSNSLPKPQRLPKIRSRAPKRAKTAMTAMSIS